MNRIRILNWNLNMGGNGQVEVADFVKNYAHNYDILVFDETVLNKSIQDLISKLGDYDVFKSRRDGAAYANQIVIATRKELKGQLIVDCLEDDKRINNPNFLDIKISYEEDTYRIIGVRILSISNRLIQKMQCMKVANYIKKTTLKSADKVVLTGDFNCGQLKGDSEKTYEEVKDCYKYTSDGKKSTLVDYNWHIIKNLFSDIGMQLLETSGESKTWGIAEWKGRISYDGAKIKNDLVIVSKNVEGLTSSYTWDFVRDHEKEYLKMLKKKSFGNPIDHGFPDHARLNIEIIKREEDD